MARGARKQALHNFPIFQHCSPVQSLQLPSWLFMTIETFTPRPPWIQQRPYPQWSLSVLKSDNDGVRYPWWWMTRAFFYWRWKSLLFNALWRHKLQRHHIRNRLIRDRKGCAFHWCIDCGKYCCLICRGRKLLGWPSYATAPTYVFLQTLKNLIK